ncbi:hypothetical protein ACE6H2_009232 [Prunus campanulata]
MEDKLDMMFLNVTATGKHSWAPSSGVLPIESDDDVNQLEVNGDSNEVVPIETTQTTNNVPKKRTNQSLEIQDNNEKKGKMLEMFLNILGHGSANRQAQDRFQHSGETVSRYFSILLDVVCRLAVDVIKPLENAFNNTPKEILQDSRYMPHFKDCIGAIDGVHVQAVVSPSNQIPFIGRKGIPTQNVMAACNFDMQFIFACAGWEGTAHDTRIFLSALRDQSLNFPKPPNGTISI